MRREVDSQHYHNRDIGRSDVVGSKITILSVAQHDSHFAA